ncbi:MAG: adenylate/guanylate cyclase domain-containing protein [Candidatus Cloacimonetes bacterium]|nr:adenylate/guanylate cyclase domain-containing protein [Candidatus Cloacimonadota bacterium]
MAMQIADDVFQQAGKTAINKTVDFLVPAIHSAKMFERVIDKKHVNPKDIGVVHDYCLQFLRVYTQFNACFYANEYGLWGAPHKDLDHEINGCRAAVLCQKKLIELSKKWHGERKPMMHTRIGLHTGPTILENIDYSERMNYTVIGDSVNLAARLEGVNNTGIIISQSTADRVKGHFAMRPLDVVRVKGKSIPVQIFELLDFLGDEGEEETQQLAMQHTEAFDLYMNMKFTESMSILVKLDQS